MAYCHGVDLLSHCRPHPRGVLYIPGVLTLLETPRPALGGRSRWLMNTRILNKASRDLWRYSLS